MRSLAIIVSIAAALAAPPAFAHAALDHASPPVGGTVPTAPHELALTFTENVEAAFSSVEVTDAGGARVDQGKPQISGNTMRVGLGSLKPGTYHVRWRALSVDTHKSEGRFTFRVGGS
jgi:methionine-rich copper-binding protein CopC